MFGTGVAHFWWGEVNVLFESMAVFIVKMHVSLRWEISDIVLEMQKGLSFVAIGGQDYCVPKRC